jgi:hypothetical protein
MSRSLSIVARNDQHDVTCETVAQRVRRLQDEARQLASDHIFAFTLAMEQVTRMAEEIAVGGDVYPAGVRDLARRFAEDCELRVQTVEAISGRSTRN